MKTKLLFLLSFLAVSFIAKTQDTNVLLIVIDDLKPVGRTSENSQILAPQIDKLAQSGVSFTGNYCQQAVCAPSRVSFLTGTRPDITRVWDLKTDMRTMVPNSLTMPEYFKQKGYITVGMGKVFHGARKNDPQSWTMKFMKDEDLEYAEGFDMPVNRDYQNSRSRHVYDSIKNSFNESSEHDKLWLAINQGLKKANARPATEALEVPDDAYADGAIAEKGMELLTRFKKKKKPFFMALGFHKPHLPFVAPQKYWDLYDREKIDLSEFREHAANSPAFAYHSYGEIRNYSDIPQDLGLEGLNGDPGKQKEVIHGYYAAVSYVDAQIGKVLDHLRKTGLDKNTVVVLIGDHGWHLGDHGIWCKHSNFEQATTTPMIIRAPNMISNQVVETPTELLDVFPTLCDLTGLPQPKTLQGASLKPILSGEKSQVKDFSLSQYPRGNRMGYALRNERYRYVVWFKDSYRSYQPYDEKKIIARELYDYEKDPLETRSLHNDPEYGSVVAELSKSLETFLRSQEQQ